MVTLKKTLGRNPTFKGFLKLSSLCIKRIKELYRWTRCPSFVRCSLGFQAPLAVHPALLIIHADETGLEGAT